MFYYLCQITNLVNNKIYIGVHKTHDMNDGYMCSGKVIKRAMEKYGSDNFRKDILKNSRDMYERKKEMVTEEFLSRNDVYNLHRGGHGGFDFINKNRLNVSTERSQRGGYQTSRIPRPLRDAQRSERMKKEHSEGTRTTLFSNKEFQTEMKQRSNSITAMSKKKKILGKNWQKSKI